MTKERTSSPGFDLVSLKFGKSRRQDDARALSVAQFMTSCAGPCPTMGQFGRPSSLQAILQKGCKVAALYSGAAPITLINGDKLIDLLLKHEVGIKKTTHNVIERAFVSVCWISDRARIPCPAASVCHSMMPHDDCSLPSIERRSPGAVGL